MSLTSEAAYLYIYTLKISNLNRKLRRAIKETKKYAQKYQEEKTMERKHKYFKKYHRAKTKVHRLSQEHSRVMAGLRHHYTTFAHQMIKEHRGLK